MGHHINDNGDFQSDKYPELAPNKIILSFKDKHARTALNIYAELTEDAELAEDIFLVLNKWMSGKTSHICNWECVGHMGQYKTDCGHKIDVHPMIVHDKCEHCGGKVNTWNE